MAFWRGRAIFFFLVLQTTVFFLDVPFVCLFINVYILFFYIQSLQAFPSRINIFCYFFFVGKISVIVRHITLIFIVFAYCAMFTKFGGHGFVAFARFVNVLYRDVQRYKLVQKPRDVDLALVFGDDNHLVAFFGIFFSELNDQPVLRIDKRGLDGGGAAVNAEPGIAAVFFERGTFQAFSGMAGAKFLALFRFGIGAPSCWAGIAGGKAPRAGAAGLRRPNR